VSTTQAPTFNTVVLDVDSTVSGIEGIDWLAARRGEATAARVRALTNDAMRGAVPLEDVYGRRLSIIRPRREEVDALAHAYIDALAPGCMDVIHQLQQASVQVILVSGGLRPALVLLAMRLGIDLADLHAVNVRFDSGGAYAGFDTASPLTTTIGKRSVIEAATLTGPVLAVGDGSTDVAMREVVDRFVGFTGFVRRDSVLAHADGSVSSFAELARLVLP
jgi:phosphoserine phosphatase